jgi:hypothetical protein
MRGRGAKDGQYPHRLNSERSGSAFNSHVDLIT